MKKLIFFLAILALSAVGYGQTHRVSYLSIADTGKYFTDYINIGDHIYNTSTTIEYVSNVNISPSAHKKLSWLLASSSRYMIPTHTSTTLNAFSSPYFVDTATNQTIHGGKVFFSPPYTSLGTTLSIANTGYGYQALFSTTTGNYNTAIGKYALHGNLGADHNTAVGTNSLMSSTTANGNTFVGSFTAQSMTTGSLNTGIGHESMMLQTTGIGNTGVGYYNLLANISGGYNSVLGYNAGYGIKTGSGNIAIGKNAGPAGSTNTTDNALYISNVVGGSDTAIIYGVMNGTPATNTLQLNAHVSTPQILCTGSSGAIFTATNGTTWKLQLSSNGTATYVTVTP
jgi:hypothetical protein